MDINYLIAAVFLLGAVILIIFLIRKNLKDKKKFEKEASLSELEPEKHDDDEQI